MSDSRHAAATRRSSITHSTDSPAARHAATRLESGPNAPSRPAATVVVTMAAARGGGAGRRLQQGRRRSQHEALVQQLLRPQHAPEWQQPTPQHFTFGVPHACPTAHHTRGAAAAAGAAWP